MNEERRGIETLRESIETVASDLERNVEARPAPRHGRATLWAGLAAAAAIAAIAAGLWLNRPNPTPEVEILELKIRGRAVQAVVVDDRAPGTLVVMPDSGGDVSETNQVEPGHVEVAELRLPGRTR